MDANATCRMPLDDARASAAALLFRKKVLDDVSRWLERLGIPERDRDDVAGEVWLCACQSWHTFDPRRARPERWLNRIAVHVSAHYHDRAWRRREVLQDNLVEVPDPSPDALSLLGAEEIRNGVLHAIKALELRERDVILEHDIEGIPMYDLAQKRELPLSTCYKWRARALAALRDEIKPRKRAMM